MSKEHGPIYGVELIDVLPLGNSGSMSQAMPSLEDLKKCKNNRIVAGYEVLLDRYRHYKAELIRLRSVVSDEHAERITKLLGRDAD